MPYPHFEVMTGPIDGVNTTFYVSLPYKPGSLAVLLNGQLKRKDFTRYGWIESNPSTGEVELTTPPLLGDVVQAFFLDMSPMQPGEEVCSIRATLVEVDLICGRILDQGISGCVIDQDDIFGSFVDGSLLGQLLDTDTINGFMYEVC